MKPVPLSKHFFLHEFTTSQTALRRGININPSPGSAVFLNLQRLCADLLEPLRAELKTPLFISSGYRPPRLNRLIGGARNSQHVTGQAADFTVPGKTPLDVCRVIQRLGLPFDQLILEFGRWTHMSVAAPGVKPRRQVLRAVRRAGRVVYLPGLGDEK